MDNVIRMPSGKIIKAFNLRRLNFTLFVAIDEHFKHDLDEEDSLFLYELIKHHGEKLQGKYLVDAVCRDMYNRRDAREETQRHLERKKRLDEELVWNSGLFQ